MEELIETVNQLQDVFSATGSQGLVNLPQIVVIGAQSSGKSSVLEHLVGKSFLPRGTGVVTRCPLVIQMVQTQGTPVHKEYVIFQHNKTKIFTDYSLISKEIEEQTDRLAGGNKGIVSTSINLKIYSSSVLNLTMIDLPGLTKVPVGDQPPDIEEKTRELIIEYIKNPNSIILAVTPANADMATSESLKIAREMDPEGTRTLAVITKVDLMDEGTDANDMLMGKVIPVKLGIVGVVNRSQKDILEGKSIVQSIKDEAEFFHSKYRNIAAQQGTTYLTQKVQTILINHIRGCLPELRESVSKKLAAQSTELHILGDSKLDKPAHLLDLITKFSNTYCGAIKGNLSNIHTEELYGGARINFVFQETLYNALQNIDALNGLSNGAVLTAMQNASGISPALFVPEVAFELLVKKQITRLRGPCLQCVELIHDELSRIVQHCLYDSELELHRFPKLQKQISAVVTDLLESRMPITNEMVNSYVDIQLAYINTAHPDFLPNSIQGFSLEMKKDNNGQVDVCHVSLGGLRLSEEKLRPDWKCWSQPTRELTISEKGNRDCVLIQELIKNYFSIVRKFIQDTVPKIIMNFMVNFVIDHVQPDLVTKLYKSDVKDLLEESQNVLSRKAELKKAIAALKEANAILNNMRAPLISNHLGVSSN